MKVHWEVGDIESGMRLISNTVIYFVGCVPYDGINEGPFYFLFDPRDGQGSYFLKPTEFVNTLNKWSPNMLPVLETRDNRLSAMGIKPWGEK
jgi:hypothetical protein